MPTTTTHLTALTDRTLALATAGEDIHRTTAQALTGLPPRRFGLLLDDGTLHLGARRNHIGTRSLVEYLTRTTDGLVTLFDHLRHKTTEAPEALRLQGRKVASAQARLTETPDQHGLPRILLRRASMPPVTSSWEKWYRGDQNQALAEMDTWRQRLRGRERRASRHAPRDANRTRVVWVAPTPPTPYDRYLREQLARRVNAGQQVRVTSTAHVILLERAGPLPEVEVYGSGVILVHHHTMLGAPNGATQLIEPELARGLTSVIDLLGSAGNPLSSYPFPVTGGGDDH